MEKQLILPDTDFALTASTLAYMQESYSFLEKLCALGGDSYYLSGCELGDYYHMSPGIIVLRGEVMPFVGGNTMVSPNFRIVRNTTPITVGIASRKEVSVYAEIGTSSIPEENVPRDEVVRIPSIRELYAGHEKTKLLSRIASKNNYILTGCLGERPAVGFGYVVIDQNVMYLPAGNLNEAAFIKVNTDTVPFTAEWTTNSTGSVAFSDLKEFYTNEVLKEKADESLSRLGDVEAIAAANKTLSLSNKARLDEINAPIEWVQLTAPAQEGVTIDTSNAYVGLGLKNEIRFKGSIVTNFTGQVIGMQLFQLPEQFRPDRNLILHVTIGEDWIDAGTHEILLMPDGGCHSQSGSGIFNLDCLSYIKE